MRRHRITNEQHQLLQCLLDLVAATEQAEQESLVRKIYNVDLSTLEECLLQLSHVCFTHHVPHVQALLRTLLLRLAGTSLHIAWRLLWTMDAVSTYCKDIDLGDFMKEFHDHVESYAINHPSCIPPSNLSSTTSEAYGTSFEEELDSQVAMRKELRLKLFNDERQFVTTLTEYSDILRRFPDRSQRRNELKRRLTEMNENLSEMLLVHPLGGSSDPVQWIVNIAVDECAVFSSRERAPYLIRYEVIVDNTATLEDPTLTRLRMTDGSFKVSSTSDDIYVPEVRVTSSVSSGNANSATTSNGATPKPRNAFQEMAFGESLVERCARVRKMSPWGGHPNWGIGALIVKAGDDLRQEELALQLIRTFENIWQEAGLMTQTHPYMILPTSKDCGLLEVVGDSNSIDGIKKACRVSSIHQFYLGAFGGEGSPENALAQQRFIESMAGYSVISYLLQIRDRHNGNLMISRLGHLVHIDFGFLFVTSPGGFNFESAPFKLSQELIDVMGGQGSDGFNYYKLLFFQALEAARERSSDLLALVSLMVPRNSMDCFGADPAVVVWQLRNRFRHDLPSEADYALFAKDLISNSADNWRTRRYDQFQALQNGIL